MKQKTSMPSTPSTRRNRNRKRRTSLLDGIYMQTERDWQTYSISFNEIHNLLVVIWNLKKMNEIARGYFSWLGGGGFLTFLNLLFWNEIFVLFLFIGISVC